MKRVNSTRNGTTFHLTIMSDPNSAIKSLSSSDKTSDLPRFTYNDGVVRLFLGATVVWGILASVLGTLAGLLLSMPTLFESLQESLQPLVTFARLNSLNVNLLFFAFAGNAIFAGIYYSTQRLCKSPLWSGALASIHFVAWQCILVGMMVALLLGYSQGRSISGTAWPIQIAIAISWVFCFGVNIVMTIVKRGERYMYVSLWFYLASVIVVGILEVTNCLVIPMGWWHSLPLFVGVQDALVQSWYSENLVAFFATMPLVGMMYYFLPKAIDRPLYSYKLSIVHFWSLILLFVCAGTKQLHFTPVPEWASTLGMLCGILLWMPSWAGLVNGLCTVSGSWQKVKQDPALRFMVVGLIVYGFTSFESSMLSFKSIHAMVHYTDWEVAHANAVAMGWNGFMVFGVIYWLLPRLYETRRGILVLGNLHFWLAAIGLTLTVVPEYCAGVVQSRKWSELSELGRLQYSFMETLQSVTNLWWLRFGGNCIYLAGMLSLGLNLLQALRDKSIRSEARVQPSLGVFGEELDGQAAPSALTGMPVLDVAAKIDQFAMLDWHRKLERMPLRLALLVGLLFCLLSMISLLPNLAFRNATPPIASVQPYTPLELVGREIYISQGCQNCHSQTIRPLVHEAQRYGAISQPGEFAYDRPVQWGNRRIGPDLAREGGGKQSSFWHWRHFEDASVMTPGTVMPVYKHLHSNKIPFSGVGKQIQWLSEVGTSYDMNLDEGARIDSKFEGLAQKQAEAIAAEIIGQGGPVAYRGNLIKDTSAVALIAYIQRLGTDLSRPATVVPSNEIKP